MHLPSALIQHLWAPPQITMYSRMDDDFMDGLRYDFLFANPPNLESMVFQELIILVDC